MENHDYDEPGRVPAILKNAYDAPYINAMARKYNLATNYLAVGHPSLTNYLEVIGGSNFGVNQDLFPHWGSAKNTKHRYGFIPAHGTDIASSSFAYSKMCCDDKLGYTVPGGSPYVGTTIADQLDQTGKTWKTYQESLPVRGGYGVDISDGEKINRGAPRYAAKHDPFEYFRSTQGSKSIVGYASNLLRKTIGGDLAKDLVAGTVADFNFIAPNLCHDMHGAPGCSEAHALIRDGDREVQALVGAISGSAVWKTGRNAIIVMWDENDFSATGNNRIPVIVMTNYQTKGMHSSRAYNHFSLLKSLEQGFGLGYLNHAKDQQIHAMSDMFAPH
jgi:phosphatidylinositol-3-phosphatase